MYLLAIVAKHTHVCMHFLLFAGCLSRVPSIGGPPSNGRPPAPSNGRPPSNDGSRNGPSTGNDGPPSTVYSFFALLASVVLAGVAPLAQG